MSRGHATTTRRDVPSTGGVDLSSRYRRWRGSRLGAITERLELTAVLEALGPLAGRRVLDAGCGDGTHALVAAEAGARVTGLDLSEELLAQARARSAARGCEVEWRRGDVNELPFPDSSFDLALAITLLCLVPDPRRAVRELSRVLVPGGRLVVGELHRWSLWAAKRRVRGWMGNAFWRDAHFWTVPSLRKLMADAGLEPGHSRGVVYFPPLGPFARVLAPVDPFLGRLCRFGAAFLVVEGLKPSE